MPKVSFCDSESNVEPELRYHYKSGIFRHKKRIGTGKPSGYSPSKNGVVVEFDVWNKATPRKVTLPDVSLSQIFRAIHDATENNTRVVDVTPRGLQNIRQKYAERRNEILNEGHLREVISAPSRKL